MRDNGKIMFDKEKALRNILMEIVILVSLIIIKHMEMVFTHGQMARYMTENGSMASNKEKVYGEDSKMIRTLVSGSSLKLMVTVFISGLMVIDMKVSGD